MPIAGRQWLAGVVCALLAALTAGCALLSRSGRPAGSEALVVPRLIHHPYALVSSIAGGGFAGYALLADGHVWAWGDGLEGQLGSAGRWRESSVPVRVRGLANVVAIAGGENNGYALQRGGAVWAWGDDAQHELGDSGYANRQQPVRVRTPSAVVAIAAGMFSAFALRRDGTVWAWGDGSLGQLGPRGCPQSDCSAFGVPVEVPGLSGVSAVAAGANTAYALRRDGTVWAWGDDSLGQLGRPGCSGVGCDTGVPVKVKGLSGVRAVAAGDNTAYALRRDGTVWAWGDNSFGALGLPIKRRFVDKPVRVSSLRHVTAITAGADSAFALLRDGSVRAWGRGAEGEIGDGRPADRAVPTPVVGLSGAIQVAAGGASAYAVDQLGRVWAWGAGDYGQLGNGYLVSLAEPTVVLGLKSKHHGVTARWPSAAA